MASVQLKLYIEPKPLKRARHAKRGNYISTYYDKTAIQEMDTLKYAIINALTEEDKQVIKQHMEAPKNLKGMAISIEFAFSIPSSYSKKLKNELINNPCTTKSDVDNLVKNILDRGNGLLFDDDRYIHTIYAKKTWREQNYILIEIDYGSTL